jgi:membrane-associated phospholipid phosphatase
MGIGSLTDFLGRMAIVFMLMAPGALTACPPQAANQREAAEGEPKAEAERNHTGEERSNATDAEQSGKLAKERSLKHLEKDFLLDQKRIWTSPERLRFSDTQWLVPLSGFAAGLFVTDRASSNRYSRNPTTISHYNLLANAGIGALAGGAGGLWLLGHMRHDAHWSETGFLAGEAALNSLVVVEGLKYTLRRERPFQGDGSGPFFQGGTSFPSEHAAAAWAIAGVIAHEYPGPLSKLLAYSAAAAISYARVAGRQHFSSDVFVGGLIGDFVAQDVYSRHHDPELPGANWRSISSVFRSDGDLSPANQGSPYVPLDSWVYAVFDRLIATGYINTAILGQRPWTRLECTRLLNESSEALAARGDDMTIGRLLDELQVEFQPEVESLDGSYNVHARVESVYTRFTNISGPPLTDPYHFGETLTNDFGRPYQRGFNDVAGFSGWATAGRWVFYARGEYQHAPEGPAFSQNVRNFIASADANPVLPAIPTSEQDRLQPLDVYVGLNLSNWQFSYGQQSMDWAPTESGSFLFSNDAVPVRMFRISRVSPFRLPWILQWMGPVRVESYFGNLVGHSFPRNPYFHGEKISFKPTSNLEFGFSRTAVLGGEGRPLTLGAVVNSYVSVTSGAFTAANRNPGKRTGGFDFSYRVPYLRNWLTIYADSASDDDPSPIDAPRRAAINSGIYIPQFPKLHRLDLRVEAAYTDVPGSDPAPGKFLYFDGFYHDLYTNKGHLLGNWVGRDGKGYQAWSRYSFSARSFLEFGFRHAEVSSQFVPGGGNLNDGSIRTDFLVHREWTVSASVQYEKWQFPILANGPQTNVSSSLGITFSPFSARK